MNMNWGKTFSAFCKANIIFSFVKILNSKNSFIIIYQKSTVEILIPNTDANLTESNLI